MNGYFLGSIYMNFTEFYLVFLLSLEQKMVLTDWFRCGIGRCLVFFRWKYQLMRVLLGLTEFLFVGLCRDDSQRSTWTRWAWPAPIVSGQSAADSPRRSPPAESNRSVSGRPIRRLRPTYQRSVFEESSQEIRIGKTKQQRGPPGPLGPQRTSPPPAIA